MRGDDEWREILAALRVFHSFCVKRGYVKEDGVLVTALFRLRTFCICTIPNRISQLARDGFWGTLENHDSRSLIDPDTATLGAHAEDEQTEPYDEWEGVLGDEMPLCVEQVMPDGWIMACDDPEEGEYTKAFLCLPVDVARLGMKGMSLSRIKLALRKGVWRPVLHDALYVGKAYPPDDVFYY